MSVDFQDLAQRSRCWLNLFGSKQRTATAIDQFKPTRPAITSSLITSAEERNVSDFLSNVRLEVPRPRLYNQGSKQEGRTSEVSKPKIRETNAVPKTAGKLNEKAKVPMIVVTPASDTNTESLFSPTNSHQDATRLTVPKPRVGRRSSRAREPLKALVSTSPAVKLKNNTSRPPPSSLNRVGRRLREIDEYPAEPRAVPFLWPKSKGRAMLHGKRSSRGWV